MKKLILTLVVLAMAAPLYAAGGITFVATDNVDGTCTVTFTATDPCIPPVAMGLDITVDGDDPCDLITAVDGIDSFFDIYMDYAYDDPCNYTYGLGNPIADPCAAGSATLPSLSFCISMGGLGGPAKPLASAPTSGTAFVLHAGNLTDPCSPVIGTISINAIRGGVIGTDTEAMTHNLTIPFQISISADCFPSSHPDYDMWVSVGKPDCWCPAPVGSDYQCRGDTDGLYEGKPATAKYVVLADLQLLSSSWQKAITDPDWIANAGTYICADFDHLYEGKPASAKHVVLGDLQILSGGWQKIVTDTHFADNPCFP